MFMVPENFQPIHISYKNYSLFKLATPLQTLDLKKKKYLRHQYQDLKKKNPNDKFCNLMQQDQRMKDGIDFKACFSLPYISGHLQH